MQQVSSTLETKDNASLMELRLPIVLSQTVLAEAKENAADLEWDLPALEEALEELRATGDTGFSTFEDIVMFAPLNASLIAQQVGLTRSQGRLKAIEGAIASGEEVTELFE